MVFQLTHSQDRYHGGPKHIPRASATVGEVAEFVRKFLSIEWCAMDPESIDHIVNGWGKGSDFLSTAEVDDIAAECGSYSIAVKIYDLSVVGESPTAPKKINQ